MAVTARPYDVFLADLAVGEYNLSTDTIAICLVTSAYTPDYAADDSYAIVAPSEASGAGYTTNGQALTSVALVPTADTLTITADPAAWVGLSVTARYAVVYKFTGVDATAKLIGAIDFGTDRVYSSEPFQISFPDGVIILARPV